MTIRIESLEKKIYKNNFSFYNFAHFFLSLILLYFVYNFKYNRLEVNDNLDLIIILISYLFFLFFIKKASEEKNKIVINFLIFGALFPQICSIILLFSPTQKLEINIVDIKSEEDLVEELRKYSKKLEDKNQIYNATLIRKVILDNIKNYSEMDLDAYNNLKDKIGEIPEYKIYKTEEIPIIK